LLQKYAAKSRYQTVAAQQKFCVKMDLKGRIEAFSELGKQLAELPPEQRNHLMDLAAQQNPWFTNESVKLSLDGLQRFLTLEKLNKWTSLYQLNPHEGKTIGVAMAGNIPLVGFHDFLCVLIAGHRLKAKLSSQDSTLLPFLTEKLLAIDPSFKNQIEYAEQLKQVDAVIATGSDNTSRYFEYYFRNIPHIIRKNRSSCGVIFGEELGSELRDLGKDVFSYFGLGCRNVSKVFVPEGYDFKLLLDSWEGYSEIINHHKYANNYDYQKSILLVNGTPFLDNNFVLVTGSSALVSPISVLFYENYKDQNDLHAKIHSQKEKIQCTVSAKGWFDHSLPFGKAQYPELWDFADNVDTLKFLDEL
jgi:hypothetical protein